MWEIRLASAGLFFILTLKVPNAILIDMEMNDEKCFDDDVASGCEQSNSIGASDISAQKEYERQKLEFQCRYNIAVVSDYENHYRSAELFCLFSSVSLGVVSLMNAGGVVSNGVLLADGLFSLVTSVLSIVYRFGDMRANERLRVSSYSKVLTKLLCSGGCDKLDECVDSMNGVDDFKRNEISRALAYNDVIDQMGLDEKYKFDVWWFARVTRFFFCWPKPKQICRVDF